MSRKTNVFTFWEGQMPDYIKLCMATWKRLVVVLNYGNLHNYTDLPIDKLKRFTLPQIADCVRVHVLRDQGGYWMDADTIMVTGNLPEADMVGDPKTRENTIGLLYSEPHSDMFTEWADYQDEIIDSIGFIGGKYLWNLMGNAFTDPYVKKHHDVKIHPVRNFWPETYMAKGVVSRYDKYMQFYFDQEYHLNDLEPTDIIMLHNSWTPGWYKRLSAKEVLSGRCTMSNVLREVMITR